MVTFKENKAHLSERKLMIRMAVASVIEKFESEPNLFLVIVREWHEVLATYRANLQRQQTSPPFTQDDELLVY